ncbi:MAG: HepT-like ribonuclease domain-containing protein [Methermicoccaceae archaeon]
MSKRDLRLFLMDILEAIEKIERYTSSLSFEEFAKSEMVIDAVVRNLEIIGEASKRLPEDVRSKYSDIPWKRVVGFRNIVIHGYFDVDLEIVWVIAKERLVELKPKIERMLEEMKG